MQSTLATCGSVKLSVSRPTVAPLIIVVVFSIRGAQPPLCVAVHLLQPERPRVQSTTRTSKTLGAEHRPWIDLAVPVKGWLEASLAMLNQYRENIWASTLFDIKTNSKGRSTTEGYSFITDCL
uniref:Uncharacterized protein n=1 Tax=Triticum urartu TaxID=4572 RepID=A0A8R7QAM5_TRIUA